jgi:hypothetical protein
MVAKAVRGFDAMAMVVGALVLVTSLVPVFAVRLAVLGAREVGCDRLSRGRDDARESG